MPARPGRGPLPVQVPRVLVAEGLPLMRVPVPFRSRHPKDPPLDNLGGTVPHVNLGNKDIHIVVPTHIMEGFLPG